MAESNERRHLARLAVRYNATLRMERQVVSVEVLDISSGGCKVKVRASFPRGLAVILEIESFGALQAVVAWSREGLVGLRFSEPPERVGELAMAMATYGPV